MSYAIPSARDSAIDNWNHALQTYRASIDLYTRVLKIQQRRGARRFPIVTSVPAPVERAASPTPILDGLTPREREVALLIARGLSNRQIAQQLVIAQGTAANHVAHIIGKLGLANRTGIAAAVASRTRALDIFTDFEPRSSRSESGASSNANPRAPFVRLSDRRLGGTGRSAHAG